MVKLRAKLSLESFIIKISALFLITSIIPNVEVILSSNSCIVMAGWRPLILSSRIFLASERSSAGKMPILFNSIPSKITDNFSTFLTVSNPNNKIIFPEENTLSHSSFE